MAEDIIRREENVDVEGIGSRISDDIGRIIEHSKHAVAVYLNTEVTLTESFYTDCQRTKTAMMVHGYD